MGKPRSEYLKSKIAARVTTLKELRDQGHTWTEISALVGASPAVVHRDWATGRGMLAGPHSRRNRTLLDRTEGVPCHTEPLPGFLDNPWNSQARPPRWREPGSTYVAWLLCAGCSAQEECFELVRPDEGFEGVAARRIWVNGEDRTDVFLLAYTKEHADDEYDRPLEGLADVG